MHYCEKDVLKLTTGVPFGVLSVERQFTQFLRDIVETGDELHHVLSQYPGVRYEPLDFHYVCLQSLSVASPELIQDLLDGSSWTGVLWGAFVACLTRDIHYGAMLRAVSARTVKRAAVLDLATRICSGTLTSADDENLMLLARLYLQLEHCPRLPVRLSASKSEEDQLALQTQVRTAYRSKGTGAALSIIRNGTTSTQ